MRYLAYLCLLSLCLSASVNAFNVQYQVTNINGGSPIENVLITVTGNETQTLNASLTDAAGNLELDINETLTFYTAAYSKIGYYTSSDNYT